MTILTVLAALFVERVLQQHRPQRRHAWFDGYCSSLMRSPLGSRLMSAPWGVILVLLLPLAVVALLQQVTGSMGGLFAFAYGAFILLLSLGPRDLGEDTDAFIAARDQGDHAAADTIADTLCAGETAHTEPARSLAVARAIVTLGMKRLIGPIFWFVVFGPVGAAAYRAVHLVSERARDTECPSGMRKQSFELRNLVDWIPARLTAAGYAVAGNFDAVAHAWRTFDFMPSRTDDSEADQLLGETGLAALDTFDEELLEADAHGAVSLDATLIPPIVEDAAALVWRTLAMWVTVIAGGSLVAAFA